MNEEKKIFLLQWEGYNAVALGLGRPDPTPGNEFGKYEFLKKKIPHFYYQNYFGISFELFLLKKPLKISYAIKPHKIIER